ncbi:MAG TPA: FAD-binding protein, partial [Solirubrobacteraceae bacterium]|nr:FAD-binding protein [Solirubrobacteraceae bacterium]
MVAEPLSRLGLAALHGSSPDVGIAGYSLGGGMGWLARRHGLQANSVTAVELVTADGRVIRADAMQEPELFWALRGGGGSFGVVTTIEFAVYPVEQLYAGAMLFPFEQASDVLGAWSELLPSLPDTMTSWGALMHLPDLPFVPEPLRGGSFAAVLAAFLGDEANGRKLLSPVRQLGPVLDTFETVAPVALSALAMDPPDPLPYLSAHRLLDEIPAPAIDNVVAFARRSSQLGIVQFRHMGGALASAPWRAGARATVPGSVAMFALGIAPDEDSAATVTSSLQVVETILSPHRVGQYPSFVEQPADASEFFDPDTWTRLCNVKAAYDPDDVFKGNHQVPPAGGDLGP